MPQLFLDGGYRPIAAGDHVIAFERARADQRLVCVVPRLPWKLAGGLPLGEVWGDATIDLGVSARWRNPFTGETFDDQNVRLRDMFASFPVAWLVAA